MDPHHTELYNLGGYFLYSIINNLQHMVYILFSIYKQCEIMKCACWQRQRFKQIYSSVCLSVCRQFKGMYVADTASGPGYLGVQTGSTTCAMTTNQSPGAPDCICYIPHKTEQNTVTLFVWVTRSTSVTTTGCFKCKR